MVEKISENNKISARSGTCLYNSEMDSNVRVEFLEACEPPMKVEFSSAKGNANLKHLYGPPTFDTLECMGKNLVFNHDNYPNHATIEKALGDKSYSVKLGGDHEELFTHDEIINALNKQFEDGHQYWVFKDIIEHNKEENKER